MVLIVSGSSMALSLSVQRCSFIVEQQHDTRDSDGKSICFWSFENSLLIAREAHRSLNGSDQKITQTGPP